MNILDYNRMMIIGNNGCGKSFLSKELAAITGLPLVHLDLEFWRPNWEMPSQDEWRDRNIELISNEKWILDGNVNHGGTMELRFEAADLIVFMDINRFVCLAGVLRRYNKKRSDMPQYLVERFDREFFQFLKGVWSFPKTRKRNIMDLHKRHPDKPFFVIHGRRKTKRLLNQWRAEKAKQSKRGGQYATL